MNVVENEGLKYIQKLGKAKILTFVVLVFRKRNGSLKRAAALAKDLTTRAAVMNLCLRSVAFGVASKATIGAVWHAMWKDLNGTLLNLRVIYKVVCLDDLFHGLFCLLIQLTHC